MDRERLDRARAAMAARGLDALLCRLPENVLLLSGCWPLAGMTFLLFPREGPAACITPGSEAREAREELWGGECFTFPFGVLEAGDAYADVARILKGLVRGSRLARVGIEEGFEVMAPPWNAAEPVASARATRALLAEVFGAPALEDATDLLYELRARKTGPELERLRRANEIATIGLRAFQAAVDVGVSGIELAALVEREVSVKGTGHRGARRVRAFAQVAVGPEETSLGYRPMEITTTRKLRRGELALLELGVVADGFWADRTRVRAAGTASSEQRDAYDAVCRAQEAAIRAVRPGATSGEVDEAARSVIRQAGRGEGFIHVTGHGLGLRYHEPVPLLRPGSDERLAEGMVHSVEPGIYVEGFGGMRVEDDVAVTPTGAEVLGPAPKELVP